MKEADRLQTVLRHEQKGKGFSPNNNVQAEALIVLLAFAASLQEDF